jgi:hypothetical protein
MMPVDTARVGTESTAPNFSWALPIVVIGGALVAAGRLFGGPLALPAISFGLLAAGFVVAASLLLRRRMAQANAEPAWLLAGALVLLGFVAALLSDGDGALIALDGMHAPPTVAAGK